MKRIREIVAEIGRKHPDDDFFSNFESSCRAEPAKRKHYRTYDDALMTLDNESWQILRDKALRHYLDERPGQRKQGFFNQLNEALAYRYLVHKGFRNIRFIKEEGKKPTPDLSFDGQDTRGFCEVKTLGISDDEIQRRSNSRSVYDGSVYVDLSEAFLRKLGLAVTQGETQIRSFGEKGLVFVIVRLDDILLDYYQNYRKQLIKFCKDRGVDNLLIKLGERGNKRIFASSALTDFTSRQHLK